MDKKTLALTLVLVTISAAVLAGLAATTFAAETNPNTNTTTTSSTSDASATSVSGNTASSPFEGPGMMVMDRGFLGGRGHGRFGGQMENIVISSAFNQTINNILGNDTDVQKLVSQGYNMTAIRPVITTTIAGDGTLTTKATSATLAMQNGTTGYAIVKIDVTNAKVTQIVIYTRTVIDKSTS